MPGGSSWCGAGKQVKPGVETIESVLEAVMHRAGGIFDDNAGSFLKVHPPPPPPHTHTHLVWWQAVAGCPFHCVVWAAN